jgi:hypothetical protein
MNTQAYYCTEFITPVKGVMIQATGENEGEFIEQKNGQRKNELNQGQIL